MRTRNGTDVFLCPQWNLPIHMHHQVEDKLANLIDANDAHGVHCHKI